ncbi:hypothetical protein GCM10027275_52790 [Rhabdobacter roseus]|uniref:Tail specific protease domain-containing protein n=1 Tax=Rhabdobacter roseus TaxID=1655419 RepID=A0A840TVT2_9BACT|nr:S41 family peptidase [Rhabdobacter roseus]MBB5287354.1 hypothetical protein [Rhabdobacter roseus]
MKLTCLFLLSWFLPASLLANPVLKNNPEHNFEVFWRLFHEQYAHFETRQVDWQQQHKIFKPKVNSSTTPEQLLTILNEMVAPLKDGHVVISPTGDLPASAKYAPFYGEFPTKELQAQFHKVTLDVLYQQGFAQLKKFNSAPYTIGGYCRSKDYGYLQLNGFGGMSLEAFNRQLDEMVSEFEDVKGLIIDIRINGGGSPAYLDSLAGRLTQVKRLVGFGRTRVHTRKHEYTPWQPYHISPVSRKQLIKPTLLLTSGATISAGDHCAMYLKELPYVKLIGENTNGIFSPMLGKKLPNGWEVSLSNGQTVSSKRVNYEGKGVPPDILVVHRQSDMRQGIDLGLFKALAVLQKESDELASKTICYEQLAVNFFADSLMLKKPYEAIAAYSTGLVEEDATLLAPFAHKCYSLQAENKSDELQRRILAEQVADSNFYHQNVHSRFYVALRPPIQPKRRWPFGNRNARRLTVAHHITIGDKNYVRLHLSQGGWKGETVLVVVDNAGHIVEHCFLSYNYLNNPFYQ